MNNSGSVLKSLLKYCGATVRDVIIVCDTLDLPPGMCRLKKKGSSAGHLGLASIIDYAGTNQISRIYVGIGRPERKEDVIAYVLGEPGARDRALIDHALTGVVQVLTEAPFDTIHNMVEKLNNRNA